MQLERRRDLANGRQGRFQAACRLGRDLPAQAKSDKSQGVRGTESPDSINQTLKKTEKLVSVFSGEVHIGSGFALQTGAWHGAGAYHRPSVGSRASAADRSELCLCDGSPGPGPPTPPAPRA